MSVNRISGCIQDVETTTTPVVPAGFVLCQVFMPPNALPQWDAHQEAYRRAVADTQRRAWRAFLQNALFSSCN